MATKNRSVLDIEGQPVEVSNIDKILFPGSGFTKGQVIDYYIRISPVLLPHLKDRPVTMKRYPDGVGGMHFYEKDAPKHTPSWVKTFEVPRKGAKSKAIRYILINDLPTLVWSANLANLEMHTFLAKAPDIQRPTYVVFDLDPGPPADVLSCAQVALWIRDILAKMKLECCVKVSGSKGIQLYVPLNTDVDYEITGGFAHALAIRLEQLAPDLIVSNMAKAERTGRVFIDWSQNVDFKTTVNVYSLRAKHDVPYISLPVTWNELTTALKKQDRDSLYFDPETALKRVEKEGDRFESILKTKQKISAKYEALLEAIDSLAKPVASVQRKSAPKKTTAADEPSVHLKKYRAKRDFTQTKEPAGADKSKASEKKMFVIQKHQASHLHYDFRLEMQGVLRSWAVPKGVPTTKGDRRLAMHVEDHPMDYARFEGTIPQGNYGAGTVMVWDIGTYEVEDDNPVRAYHSGKLSLVLHGKKLKGQWALVRNGKDKYGKESWFLIKTKDNIDPIGPRIENQSALTKRTMEQIEKAPGAVWHSNRKSS